MATRGSVVEVAVLANITDLKAKMAEAGVVVDSTGAKVGTAFDKGTTKAGGAITSLSTKLQAMGVPGAASIGKIGTALDNASSKGQKFSSIMGAVGKATVIGGAAAAVAFGLEAVKLADTYEKSHASLDAAIKASGGSLSAWGSQITATDKKMESLGFTNAQTEAALAHSVVATQSVGKSLNSMGLAADLARMKGVDLATATDIINKALAGNLRGLTSMGISLPIVAASAEKLKVANQNVADSQARVNAIMAANPGVANAAGAAHNKYELAVLQLTKAQYTLGQMSASSGQIVNALTQRLGGQSTTYAKTFAGSIDVLKARMSDAGKSIGQWLIPKLTEAANWMVKNEGKVKDLAIAIGTILGMAVAVFAGQTVAKFVGGIGKMISGIQGLILKMSSMGAASTADFSMIGTEAQLAAEKESASFTAADATVVTGNTGLLASFRALGLGAVAALAPILIALAAVATAATLAVLTVKALHAPPKISTGNYKQALAQYTSTGQGQFGGPLSNGGSPTGQPMSPAQMAAWEVANYKADHQGPKANKTISGVSPLDTSGRPGAVSTTPAGSGINQALVNATGAAAGGTTAAKSATVPLTAAQIALQLQGIHAGENLRVASAGGTSLSQQSGTLSHLTAALTAVHHAALDKLVAQLNATGNTRLGTLATNLTTQWASATAKLTTILDSDTKQAQAKIGTMQNSITSDSLTKLKEETTGIHKTQLDQLVKELVATHTAAGKAQANQLNATFKAAQTELAATLEVHAQTAYADEIQKIAAATAAQTTAVQNAATAQTSVVTETAQRQSDAINAATTAISDAAKILSDAASAQVQSINDQTTIATNAATSQATQIGDLATKTADTLGERGLYGLNLVAQEAKVSLDVQKQTDDANISAAQAHVDQVTAQTNASTAIAQQISDRVTQQTNASMADAQQAADTQAIAGTISLAGAQAAADAQGIIAAINNATAQGSVDAAQWGSTLQQNQANAALKVAEATGTAAVNTADATLAGTQATVNAQNATTQTAYQLAQSNASQQQALASAALAAAQSSGAILSATAQQQLGAIQSGATVTEAKLNSIYQIAVAAANTQFAGGGTVVNLYGVPANNAAAIGNAVDWAVRTATPAPIGS